MGVLNGVKVKDHAPRATDVSIGSGLVDNLRGFRSQWEPQWAMRCDDGVWSLGDSLGDSHRISKKGSWGKIRKMIKSYKIL